MKKITIFLMKKYLTRSEVFDILYSRDEKTAIINALYRRADGSLDYNFEKKSEEGRVKKEDDYDIHRICQSLAYSNMGKSSFIEGLIYPI